MALVLVLVLVQVQRRWLPPPQDGPPLLLQEQSAGCLQHTHDGPPLLLLLRSLTQRGVLPGLGPERRGQRLQLFVELLHLLSARSHAANGWRAGSAVEHGGMSTSYRSGAAGMRGSIAARLLRALGWPGAHRWLRLDSMAAG